MAVGAQRSRPRHVRPHEEGAPPRGPRPPRRGAGGALDDDVADLDRSGVREEMLRRAAAITASGAQIVALLALSDDDGPVYDHDSAAALAALGVPAFACTPVLLPQLMAAAIERRDLGQCAGERLG